MVLLRHAGRALCRWVAAVAIALPVSAAAIASGGLAASAATDLAQCNGGDGAKSYIVCDITIVNTLNLTTNVTSSTVTVDRRCDGTNVDCVPTTPTTTTSTQLITSVHQCNNAGNGGGSTMRCTVGVTNNITGSSSVVPATVNQCNGSGDGLGAPKVSCSPFPATTTGADVTQCNGSANGGTLVALTCTVAADSTRAAALPISITQCNGSDNGGGSQVTCTARVVTNLLAPSTPTPVASPAASPASTPQPTASPAGGTAVPVLTPGTHTSGGPRTPITGDDLLHRAGAAMTLAGLGLGLVAGASMRWPGRPRSRQAHVPPSP